MGTGTILLAAGSALGGIFALLGLLFAGMKERACILISGFNTIPKEEREKYDQKKLSRDQRNRFFLWAAIWVGGGIGSLLAGWIFWVGAAAWLLLFFRQVHLIPEKAFESYKKEAA